MTESKLLRTLRGPARASLLAAAASLCIVALPARADSETRYTVTIQTQVGGQLSRRVDNQGVVHSTFSYRDNGRGPDIDEQYSLGLDGLLKLPRRSILEAVFGVATERRHDGKREPGTRRVEPMRFFDAGAFARHRRRHRALGIRRSPWPTASPTRLARACALAAVRPIERCETSPRQPRGATANGRQPTELQGVATDGCRGLRGDPVFGAA